MSKPREGPLSESKHYTHQMVIDQLQAAGRECEAASINAACSNLSLFNKLVSLYGLEAARQKLLKANKMSSSAFFIKIINSKSLLQRVIDEPKDLSFLVKQPELAAFIRQIILDLMDRPESLRKLLKELGPVKYFRPMRNMQLQSVVKILGQILSDEDLIAQLPSAMNKEEKSEPGETRPIEEFLAIISHQLAERPGWLEYAFTEFADKIFNNRVIKAVLHTFLKQKPEYQLSLLLAIKNKPILTRTEIIDGELTVEDAIMNEPVRISEAVYLNMDLPFLVNAELEVYSRKTLARFNPKVSPLSREGFTENDIRPLSKWLAASVEERFVMIVQNQLTPYENRKVAARDILNLVQTPLLRRYIIRNPLYDLVQRLNKLHSWESEDAPTSINDLRVKIGQAYFPPENERVPSMDELEKQLAKLEKPQASWLACLGSCFYGYRK